MLNVLRKSVTSWVGMGILVLALGALVFTLFQPSGPPAGRGASGPVLATVGQTPITEGELVRMVDRAVTRERQGNPEITIPQFVAAGGSDLVLAQMVSSKAMKAFGDANGMVISRRMVDGEIASIPAVQVNGKFDDATFRRLLRDQRMSEEELREAIESDLLRRQLLQPVAMGQTVPRGMAEPFAQLLLEVRRGAILPVPSAAMPDPGLPGDAQLKAFHAANANIYTIPERRAFRHAEFGSEAFEAAAIPTPAEIEKYFKDNAAEFGGVETRRLNQIILRDEAAARQFRASAMGSKSFAKAAEGEGFSAEDVALGVQSRAGLAAATNAAVADAAFALTAGNLTAPIQGPLGWHVLEVVEILPAKPQALAAVSADIEKKLQAEKVQDLLADAIAKAEDRLNGGESLADVAKDLGLTLQEAPPLTADGRSFDADFAVTELKLPVLPRVFEADQADGAQLAETEGGRYALFEISEVVPPLLVPLEKIREAVVMAWQIRTRSDAAKVEAERIASEASAGKSLVAAIGSRRLPPPQELAVRRLELTQMAQQGQQVPPPVVMLLNTPQGQARVIPAPGGQGWFVVKVDAVQPGNLAEAPQLVDAVRQSFAREAGIELVETFVRAIERDVGVVQKPDATKAVNRRLTGAQVE